MITILTGESGTGKTTLCARVAATLGARGLDVAGVLTLPRFVNDEKVGMDVADVRTSARIALATRAARGAGTADLKWKFDEMALARGAHILRAATPCDLLIVDELGPLELIHGAGWFVAFEILQAQNYRDALVVVRPTLIENFRARINLATRIVTLTPEKREQVFGELMRQWEVSSQSPNHPITQSPNYQKEEQWLT